MTTYTEVFGGGLIAPSQYTYRAVTLSQNETLQWPVETNTGSNRTADIMDVTSNNNAFILTLPAASLVSPGQSILFNNIGVNDFVLADSAGTSIASIAAGSAWVVYVTDNSTAAGVWELFQFGAAAAAANANLLAGYGLTAISSTLNQSMPVTTINTNYGAGTADRASAILWTGGTGTLTLTSPATLGTNWFVYVRNSGTNTLTITPATGQIDGSASLALSTDNSCIIFTDGSNFYTVGRGQASVISYTYLSINVAGTGDYTLSAAEQSKSFYKFTGLLTGNRNIIVPTTTAQYIIDNSTTGAFTLTVKTAAGAGVTIIQGARSVIFCDGTDVLDGDTGGISTPVSIADGGTGATTATNARTNLGGTTVGVAVFTAASEAAARSAISAVQSGINATASTLTSSAGQRLLGRYDGSSGTLQEITLGANMAWNGSAIEATGGGTGSVSSVGLSVPAFLSVSGSPVTTSGTLAVSLSGTALPVANGGTGVTSSTGSGAVVLGTSPTLTTPTITVNDNALTIRDNTDTTKLGVFELSGISPSTTRTITWPNENGTMVLSSRSISTTSPLSGGGDFSANRTFSISTNGIGNSLLAQVATATFKGRTTAGTGNVEDLTVTQATALLNTFTTSLTGLVPSSGGGTINYMRADGTWAAPPGTTNQTITLSGDLSGSGTTSINAQIGAGVVGATELGTDAVTTIKILNDNVTYAKIAAADIAAAADMRANTASHLLSTTGVWAAAAEVSVTYAASVALDFSTGINFAIGLAGNITLAQPTNLKVGQSGYIWITQDATGGRTITYNAYYWFPASMDKSLYSSANSATVIYYQIQSSTRVLCSVLRGMGLG